MDGDRTPDARRDPERELLLFDTDIFVTQTRLKMRQVPDGWHDFERVPVRPRRIPVTVALDADMVDWFRLKGAGWHGRIERVLRAFMLAVQSREVLTDRDYDWRGRPLGRLR